jgi:voltage-gated sodium channel
LDQAMPICHARSRARLSCSGRRMKQLERLHTCLLWRIGIAIVVFANSIILGAITEVPEGSTLAIQLGHLNGGLLALLVADVALCVVVKRLTVLHSGWDLFDITVTLVSVIPTVHMLSAFRVLRVIRVLRLISFFRWGRAIMDAMFGALRNMAPAFVVLYQPPLAPTLPGIPNRFAM